MFMLISGLSIWVAVHLFPSVFPGARRQLLRSLGSGVYQGLFALCILGGLLLIIFGWKNSLPQPLYAPAAGLRGPAMLLVLAGFILIMAANFSATRFKRVIRHPQLCGVLLWAIAHLMTNGDSRSLWVFGVIGLWSLVSMFTINHRDGRWTRPEPPVSWTPEVIIVVAGTAVALLVAYFHQFLAGVKLFT